MAIAVSVAFVPTPAFAQIDVAPPHAVQTSGAATSPNAVAQPMPANPPAFVGAGLAQPGAPNTAQPIPAEPPAFVGAGLAQPGSPLAQTATMPDPVGQILDSIETADWSGSSAVTLPINSPLPFPPGQHPELLREFRCRSITFKRYSRTQRTVNVFVYNFADTASAFGAYSTMRLGSSNVIVRGDASSEDDDAICFLKGTRFVTISTTAEEDEVSKQLSSQIAAELSARIPEQGVQPYLLTALPVLDRMRGTERIFMGPVAARKFMPIPFLQTLRIESSRGAVFADYQFPHPEPDRVKAMVVDYGDVGIAGRVYAAYAGQIAEIHKVRPISAISQLSRAKDSWMLCMQSGPRVCIIAGAKRKISPLVLARQLAY